MPSTSVRFRSPLCGAWRLAVATVLLLASCWAAAQSGPAACWKPSYGRGVGQLPTVCQGGQGNDAGLCYSACPPGRIGVGPACHTPCPAGWAPVGADPTAVSCWKPALANDRQFSYGRGAGHVLILSGPDNCRKEAASVGVDGCEQNGLLLYPRCKAGYVGVGPVCWQQLQACPAGFRDDGLACAKPPLQGRGAGGVPQACSGGGEYQAGLCYDRCRSGFDGTGPVCWGQCPRSMPVNCGLMCGNSAAACQGAVTQQVLGVLEVVGRTLASVATAGMGTTIMVGTQAGLNAVGVSAQGTTQMVTNLVHGQGGVVPRANASANDAIQKAVAAAGTSGKLEETEAKLRSLVDDHNKKSPDKPVQMNDTQVRNLALASTGMPFDARVLDPTGIARLVRTFELPMCQPEAPLPASVGARVVKASPEPTVHLVDPSGTRWSIASMDVFLGCGFQPQQIQEWSPQVIATLPEGGVVDSVQACVARRDLVRPVGMVPVVSPAPDAGPVKGQPAPDPLKQPPSGGPPKPPPGWPPADPRAGAPVQPQQPPPPLLGSQVPPSRSSVLDPVFYLATYADLRAAFGQNTQAALQHWLQFGMAEGRQASAGFDTASYLARYPDLKRAFGNQYVAAVDHWVQHGHREGRDPRPGGRLPQGAIIRLPDSGATYVVDAGGAKRWVTSPQVFDGCGLSWNLAQDLRRAVIDTVPTGPQLNTVAECRAAAGR